TFFVYQIYRWAGPRPLVVKLVNAVLGAAGIVILVWMMGMAFPAGTALMSGVLVSLWPTHVFYTSQNLKEAPANFLAYAGLACALAAGLPSEKTIPHRAALAATAVLAMIGAGYYRPPVLAALAAALIAALAL